MCDIDLSQGEIKHKKFVNNDNKDDIILHYFKVATEVGGAFVNGTAEEVFNRGALWCIAPVGYSLRLNS